MNNIKNLLNFALCKYPKLYINIINKLLLGRGYYHEKKSFLSILKKGDIIMDIGANNGYFSILFSHITGKKGKVFSIEAIPDTYKLMNQNIRKHCKHKNISTYNIAISNLVGLIEMYLPGNDTGQASIKKHGDNSWKEADIIKTYNVNATILDEFIEDLSIKKVDFLKIDIEGAEKLAMEGGKNLLKYFMPVIQFELYYKWLKDFQTTPLEIYDLLRGLGYDTFYILEEQITKITDDFVKQRPLISDHSTNIVVFSKNKHYSRILDFEKAFSK
ncbi:MAG TPA: FkbM family methyltransferase [Bacteroidales bacterium]